MRRLGILFLACGFMGVLITWGTTWWLVADLGPAPPGMAYEDTVIVRGSSENRGEYTLVVGRTSGLALLEAGSTEADEAYSSWYRDGNEDATRAFVPYMTDREDDVIAIGMAYQGVPFSAMKSVVAYTEWEPDTDLRTYRVIRGLPIRDISTTESWDAVLPTSIVWDGFLSNSALWGLLVMLVYGVTFAFWRWAKRWATTP